MSIAAAIDVSSVEEGSVRFVPNKAQAIKDATIRVFHTVVNRTTTTWGFLPRSIRWGLAGAGAIAGFFCACYAWASVVFLLVTALGLGELAFWILYFAGIYGGIFAILGALGD